MSTNAIKMISTRIIKASKKLYNNGLIIGNSGNISARIPGTNTFLIKSSGSSMEPLTPKQLVLVSIQGEKIRGEAKVSLETPIHSAIYRIRKDVQAIVHTHAPTATAFGIAKTEISPLQIEFFMLLPNGVPILTYKQPGSRGLADEIQKKIAVCDAVILENHGIVTVGPTIEAACNLNQMVEEAAKIQLTVMTLDSKRTINLAEIKEKFKTQKMENSRNTRKIK